MPRSGHRSVVTDKDVFTTGEVARICGVSTQTIIRCFDAGRLQGFRVPGSRSRRIPRSELIRFMETHRMATSRLVSERTRVLVVVDEQGTFAAIRNALGHERFEVCHAPTGFDAGLLTERFAPAVMVLDRLLPDMTGITVLRRIRANTDLKDTKILLLSVPVSEKVRDQLRSEGADELLFTPIDPQSLLRTTASLLGEARGGGRVPEITVSCRDHPRARISNQ